MTNYRRIFIDNSYVFITIVTFNRNPFLINNIELLRESFRKSKDYFKYTIFSICVLPDHIHMILKPEIIDDYPKIIHNVKYYFSRNIPQDELNKIKTTLNQSNIDKQDKGLWQRRYWEHTIRSEEELSNYFNYIHYNPVKHGYVLNVEDWTYSSFHKYVDFGFYDYSWKPKSNISSIKEIDYD